jgi:gamma-glutamylcyclotransferase (GGCT)/AIG2-like uncharacterized protein YtfP
VTTPVTDQPRAIRLYVSLRRAGSNFQWIAAHVIEVEPAILEGHVLYGLGLPFPYAAPGPGRVMGDLLHIADGRVEEVLAALDQLEGYEGEDADSHHNRVICSVLTNHGAARAWVYVAGGLARWALTTEHLVPSGDWSEAAIGGSLRPREDP